VNIPEILLIPTNPSLSSLDVSFDFLTSSIFFFFSSSFFLSLSCFFFFFFSFDESVDGVFFKESFVESEEGTLLTEDNSKLNYQQFQSI